MTGALDVAQTLLKHGADVNMHSMSPLHYACREGYLELVQTLLAHGADMSARSEKGWTPLHYACRHRLFDIAKLLIAHGANVWEKNLECDKPVDFCEPGALGIIDFTGVLASLKSAIEVLKTVAAEIEHISTK